MGRLNKRKERIINHPFGISHIEEGFIDYCLGEISTLSSILLVPFQMIEDILFRTQYLFISEDTFQSTLLNYRRLTELDQGYQNLWQAEVGSVSSLSQQCAR